MDDQGNQSGLNLYNPLFPMEYFPSRVNRVVVTVRMMAENQVAGGAFDPVTNIAYVPIGNAARDRAIRRHEASHANLPPVTAIKMTALFQGVEDMRIHVLANASNNDQSRRDELVFALVDMRDSVRLILPELRKMNPTMQRNNLIPVVRAMAILHYGVTNRRGCESKAPEARVAKMIKKVLHAYERCFSLTGLQAAIDKAVAALEHDDVAKATKIMRPFLTLASNKESHTDQPKGEGKPKQSKQNEKQDKNQSPTPQPLSADDEDEDEQDKKPAPKKLPKEAAKEADEKKSDKKESEKSDDEADETDPAESGDSESDDESEEDGDNDVTESDEDGDDDGSDSEGESDETEGEDVPCDDAASQPTGTKGGIGDCGEELQKAMEDGRITNESIALLDPETIKELLGESSRGSFPTMKIHKLDYRLSKKITQGIDYKLSHSGSRINIGRIPRIFDPKPGKIFERIGEQKGGTVLIDASGSMNLDDQRLSSLAEKLPIGQIAYYSGSRNRCGVDGTLVIYSKDGRSYKLNAGEKLPDVYGGNIVDFPALQWLLKQPAPRWLISDNYFCGAITTDAAHELAQRAYARKLITFFCTLGELEVSLHMRNELDDHDKMMFERSGGDKLLSRLSPCPSCNGVGQHVNPDGAYWPDGLYFHSCASCGGKGVRTAC